MYNLPYHKAPNEQAIKDLIEKYPFAFLSGCDASNKPVATQVPLFLEDRDDRKFLTGHLMRNTDHHKAFMHNDQVLAVFTGNHTYVSGSWYSDPHTASTWNYMSVHAHGTIRFLDGEALEEMLRKTSLHFENNNPHSPTVYDNLSKSFLDKFMKAIVAFEIEVTKLDSVFKLSQDRDEQSYHNIIKKLQDQDEDGKVVAAEMEKQAKDLYSK